MALFLFSIALIVGGAMGLTHRRAQNEKHKETAGKIVGALTMLGGIALFILSL